MNKWIYVDRNTIIDLSKVSKVVLTTKHFDEESLELYGDGGSCIAIIRASEWYRFNDWNDGNRCHDMLYKFKARYLEGDNK